MLSSKTAPTQELVITVEYAISSWPETHRHDWLLPRTLLLL